jgi:hypothetical protein
MPLKEKRHRTKTSGLSSPHLSHRDKATSRSPEPSSSRLSCTLQFLMARLMVTRSKVVMRSKLGHMASLEWLDRCCVTCAGRSRWNRSGKSRWVQAGGVYY